MKSYDKTYQIKLSIGFMLLVSSIRCSVFALKNQRQKLSKLLLNCIKPFFTDSVHIKALLCIDLIRKLLARAQDVIKQGITGLKLQPISQDNSAIAKNKNILIRLNKSAWSLQKGHEN